MKKISISLVAILTLLFGMAGFVSPVDALVVGRRPESDKYHRNDRGLSASYTDIIGFSEKGACWDTADNPNPTLEDCLGKTSIPVTRNGGTIEGLSPNTTYNLVIYAIKKSTGEVGYSPRTTW